MRGFIQDIETLAIKNDKFRQVLYTAKHCQLVLIHGVACACEQYIRERPLRSVLISAGIGLVLGHFWTRR